MPISIQIPIFLLHSHHLHHVHLGWFGGQLTYHSSLCHGRNKANIGIEPGSLELQGSSATSYIVGSIKLIYVHWALQASCAFHFFLILVTTLQKYLLFMFVNGLAIRCSWFCYFWAACPPAPLCASSLVCLLHFSKTISKTLPIRTNNFTKMILELEIVSDFMLEEKVVFCYKWNKFEYSLLPL